MWEGRPRLHACVDAQDLEPAQGLRASVVAAPEGYEARALRRGGRLGCGGLASSCTAPHCVALLTVSCTRLRCAAGQVGAVRCQRLPHLGARKGGQQAERVRHCSHPGPLEPVGHRLPHLPRHGRAGHAHVLSGRLSQGACTVGGGWRSRALSGRPAWAVHCEWDPSLPHPCTWILVVIAMTAVLCNAWLDLI